MRILHLLFGAGSDLCIDFNVDAARVIVGLASSVLLVVSAFVAMTSAIVVAIEELPGAIRAVAAHDAFALLVCKINRHLLVRHLVALWSVHLRVDSLHGDVFAVRRERGVDVSWLHLTQAGSDVIRMSISRGSRAWWCEIAWLVRISVARVASGTCTPLRGRLCSVSDIVSTPLDLLESS